MARPRLMVIGLDGLGLEQTEKLAGSGCMPNLAALFEAGLAWSTSSPLPEVSPVCWGTMFSGKNPGEHGVFGFGEPSRSGYRVEPVDASSFKAPRLWELMSRAGRPSLVLNVPLTYPARPLVGGMISGFVAPELRRAVYPPELLTRLEDAGYRPEADMDLGINEPQALLQDLEQVIRARLDIFEQMLDGDWELYLAVVTDTDRINHFFWPAVQDPAHPLAAQVRELFGLIDRFIGRAWQKVRAQVESGEASFLIAADHAFGPIETEVYLNRWLVEQGYLQVLLEPEGERILPQSQALALDPGRIYLHRSDRFEAGSLTPGDKCQELRGRIASQLLDLRQPGSDKPCLVRVHCSEDIYSGPYLDQAPDLVLEAAPGVSLRAGLAMPGVFGLSHLSGTHRPQGALALWLGAPLPNPPGSVQGLFGLMTNALGM